MRVRKSMVECLSQVKSAHAAGYCVQRNLSDLTIIAIIATRRKNAVAIFSIALYVIYKLERNR